MSRSGYPEYGFGTAGATQNTKSKDTQKVTKMTPKTSQNLPKIHPKVLPGPPRNNTGKTSPKIATKRPPGLPKWSPKSIKKHHKNHLCAALGSAGTASPQKVVPEVPPPLRTPKINENHQKKVPIFTCISSPENQKRNEKKCVSSP